MPKKKIYRTVTKHAVTRGNQRLGSTKNGIDALTKRAKQDGLGWNDTTAELPRTLSSRSVHGCTNKYYVNAIYVFGKGNILVTVLNIDTSFDKELYKYTTYPVFVIYKQNRYKFAKDKTKMNQEIAAGTDFYKNRVLEITAPNRVGIKCIKTLPNKQFSLRIQSDVLPEEIVAQIKAETGLDVEYIDEVAYGDEVLKQLKADIRKWFFCKVALSPKIRYINEQTVRVQVKTMSDKIKLKDRCSAEFEKEFHRRLDVKIKESKPE